MSKKSNHFVLFNLDEMDVVGTYEDIADAYDELLAKMAEYDFDSMDELVQLVADEEYDEADELLEEYDVDFAVMQ
jgi:hypothetical protein